MFTSPGVEASGRRNIASKLGLGQSGGFGATQRSRGDEIRVRRLGLARHHDVLRARLLQALVEFDEREALGVSFDEITMLSMRGARRRRSSGFAPSWRTQTTQS